MSERGARWLAVAALCTATACGNSGNQYAGCSRTGEQRFRNSSQWNGTVIMTVAVAQDKWECRDGRKFWWDAQ